jgi:hypothetical protein
MHKKSVNTKPNLQTKPNQTKPKNQPYQTIHPTKQIRPKQKQTIANRIKYQMKSDQSKTYQVLLYQKEKKTNETRKT